MAQLSPVVASETVRPADSVSLQLGIPYPILMAAYYRWKAEGFFPMIFPTRPDLTLWEFLDGCYKPTAEPVACCYDGSLTGIGWICQAWKVREEAVAEVGAAFFKGTPLSVWRRSLDLLLHHAFIERQFAAIYGLVPAAAKFGGRLLTRWCGMRIVEQLPWDEEVAPEVTVYSLSREAWERRHPEGAIMTYEQFREFGFVSKLSDALVCGPFGGGKTSANVNNANAIAQQQIGAASGAGSRSAADYAQFKSLIQPLITRDTALASGNRSEALAASMPVISKLSAGFTGAKQALMNSMPAGAARDRALADLSTTQATTVANAQAGAVQEAPKNLAQVGAGVGQMSLQELGAMLSGYQGAAQTNLGAGQMGAAQQASLMNFFKSLMDMGSSMMPAGGKGNGTGMGTPGAGQDFAQGSDTGDGYGEFINDDGSSTWLGGNEPPTTGGTTGPGSGGTGIYQGPGWGW